MSEEVLKLWGKQGIMPLRLCTCQFGGPIKKFSFRFEIVAINIILMLSNAEKKSSHKSCVSSTRDKDDEIEHINYRILLSSSTGSSSSQFRTHEV